MLIRPALINVMAKAAEKAGRGLTRDFGEVEQLQISRKGPADFVSNADLKAQAVLREELSKARPNFGFLGEENDGGEDSKNKAERWIVDPLDGTTNFLHGVPQWCISIAAEREGEIVAGMIYNPISNEMFWAERGVGAYCSNKRIRVSGRTDLSECLLAFGITSQVDVLKKVAAVAPHAGGVRAFGSAALNLAYVAAGRMDGYWCSGLGIWDVAAGVLIIKEAGGFVAPMVAGQDPVKTATLIASNAGIHDKLVQIIRSA